MLVSIPRTSCISNSQKGDIGDPLCNMLSWDFSLVFIFYKYIHIAFIHSFYSKGIKDIVYTYKHVYD